MGIKFTCPACGGALNVKSDLAGKRGRCPKCQAKINIPLEGAAGGQAAEAPPAAAAVSDDAAQGASPFEAPADPAPVAAMTAGPFVSAEEQPVAVAAPQPATAGTVDPIAEAPTLQWYAVPPGAASQYGPAGGEEFRVWMHEGRITADALVWRQDWADWKRAGTVFPQLESPPAAGVAIPAAAAIPTAAIPSAGPMSLPTAAAAMPMMAGGPPVAQPAFPMAPAMPAAFPTAAAVPADAFPIAADEPAGRRAGAGRGRAYRQRSNTGPIIAIVVLLVAMIPLSYFVWKVVSDQLGSAPAETATGSDDTKQ